MDASKLMSDVKFYGDYARFDQGEYESWTQAVSRVMGMHRTMYADKMTPTLESYFEKIESAYERMDLLGSQRALQFGGEQLLRKHAKMYNCFDRSTRFVTDKGIKSFSDFDHGDEITVLTHTGKWKRAVVKQYGEQKLNEVIFNTSTPSKNATRKVLVTGDHRWILADGKETTSLTVGDKLYHLSGESFAYDSASPFERLYWCYGYVYGDGTKVKNKNGEYVYSMVRLCRQGKDVEKYLPRFEEMGFSTSTSLSLAGDYMAFTGKYLKTVPDLNVDSPELIRAFVYGYLSADAEKNRNNTIFNGVVKNEFMCIQSSDEDHIEFFRNASCVAGVHIFGEEDFTGQVTNFAKDGRKHTVRFNIRDNQTDRSSWMVSAVTENVKTDIVWCLEVEDDHSFVLEGGIVTGNCTASYADRPAFFGEFIWLLLCGAGAGFSVQTQHVDRLPKIRQRNKSVKRHVVEDSIEGWATAFDVLFSSFFKGGGKHPEFEGHPVWFDTSKVRQKGSHISGGFKAPGPEPLQYALSKIELLLTNAGERLKPIEVYDACMFMADAVISGGVRRSATICLFSKDDLEMLNAKTGDWYVTNPQRGRSNNSVVLKRDEVTEEEFSEIMASVKDFGEPGFIFVDDYDYLVNPCVSGDTLLTCRDHGTTIDGEMNSIGVTYQIPIRDYVRLFAETDMPPMVLSYNSSTGKNEWATVSAAALTRKDADVIKLETTDGATITLTPDHLVYTENRGWVEAKDLAETDVLLSISE